MRIPKVRHQPTAPITTTSNRDAIPLRAPQPELNSAVRFNLNQYEAVLATMSLMEQYQVRDQNAPAPLVHFLVGGAQKAGTTALHKMLSQHPEIFLPEQKELHFFDNDRLFENAIPSYDQYHQFFEHRASGQLCGEATPSYLYHHPVPERVHQYSPAMKWIIVLRHPVIRAYSHWNMQRNRGIESLEFLDALKAEPKRMQTLPSDERAKYAYFARGRYTHQLAQLLTHFDRKQCLFLTSDALRNDSDQTLLNITRFLGVNNYRFESVYSHQGNYKNDFPNDLLKPLSHMFVDDVNTTEKLTSLDLASWTR